jgi:hypothetical protein
MFTLYINIYYYHYLYADADPGGGVPGAPLKQIIDWTDNRLKLKENETN